MRTASSFFSVVTALHHQAVDQSLDDRHLSLLELLLGITASGVGEVNGVADLNVICEGDILHLNILSIPFSKKFDFLAEFRDFLRER